MKNLRIIISGGGTGGHIFPALSIAGELKRLNPENEILFVGAEGKMEMEKVPAAGYEIIGLPVAGLQRRLSLSNLTLPFKLIKSLSMAGKIIDEFKPDVAIGVGGYASAPLLYMAARKGIPTLIQEQNSFAGLANRMLGKKASCICVAYEGMEQFFPADKIVFTGNPIRPEIVPATEEMKDEACKYYGLDRNRKHVLITGGSLGCKTLNEAMKLWISAGRPGGRNLEVIWQCGKYYKSSVDQFMKVAGASANRIHHCDFIGRMDLAYAIADVVVARSGASTISELCAAHKATIFVPSPNVTNDHQTHNAMALVEKDAAMMIPDAEAPEKLMRTTVELAVDSEAIAELEKNIAALERRDAVSAIAAEVYKLVE